MSSLIPSNCPEFVTQRCELYTKRIGLLERRAARPTLLGHSGAYPWLLAYPSPPMSNPPSPPRTRPYEILPASRQTIASSLATTTGGPINTFASALATTLPPAQEALVPAFSNQPFAIAPFPYPPSSGPTGQVATYQQPSVLQSTSSSEPSLPSTAGPSTRGGRRSKTHVASACIHCKRAHLSCDDQRPCGRCVASGKQDTCIDVQHKKRGRPRLREESDASAQQTIPESSSPSASIVATPSQPLMRPIAEPRRHRAGSFRSLRSQASDDSGPLSITASTPGRLPPTSMFSPYGMRQPPPSTSLSGFELATALLNTDFVIIRANRPFEDIMFGGRNVRDRNIAELASPADGDSFQSIRNRLRAEREAREPAYMPPIIQPGQDPVLRIGETDAEQYTHGFNDNTYTWRQRQTGSSGETFPARVRLAKATAYFVVVTLPSFRPVEQSPAPLSIPRPQPFSYGGPLMVGPPLHSPEPMAPRDQMMRSAPPMGHFALQSPASTMPPPYGSTYTYPPPQPLMPFQQPGYVGYPQADPSMMRLPATGPPTETRYTPWSHQMGMPQHVGTAAMYLPPMDMTSMMRPGGLMENQTGGDGASEEEYTGDGRPTGKRRRMGIDDVLQRSGP
ncbi:hypothetical protein LTR56_012944 [Elasticomyces elasticus]|nr:hypothetical protein LTR56_012944 [Elasticomyces elasticus]KAK3667986.1 hypothetical protein LTR22_001053 [Elasticomyces elasticus]KAK4925073.1 hypothetical protein LTR49_007846 [Elasticomyces elasticus]KAK5767626.1 hypothetical protein LTS12_002127 [Elasticomyces elasticus]